MPRSAWRTGLRTALTAGEERAGLGRLRTEGDARHEFSRGVGVGCWVVVRTEENYSRKRHEHLGRPGGGREDGLFWEH